MEDQSKNAIMQKVMKNHQNIPQKKYSLFKKQSDRFQIYHASNKQKIYEIQLTQLHKFKEQEMADTIKQVVKEVIADVRINQYKKKQQQNNLMRIRRHTYDQEEIFCQKCGSGPYATAPSYKKPYALQT